MLEFDESALPRALSVSRRFKPCKGFKDNLISLGCNKLLSIMNVKVYAALRCVIYDATLTFIILAVIS